MKRLLLILLLFSNPLHANELDKDELKSLMFSPTPIESNEQMKLQSYDVTSKHVRTFIIVNNVYMAPVDKD